MRALSLLFDGDDATAITSASAADEPAGDAPAYNIAGQRVNVNAKGLVIVKGKKIINNN